MEKKWYQQDLSKKWWFWVLLAGCLLFIVLAYSLSSSDTKEDAKEKAQYYISNYTEDRKAYSREELIEKLERDGYSKNDATYGADNSGADWKQQAAFQAGIYLVVLPNLTKNELYEMLLKDGFTEEQALYGIRANGFY